MTTLLNMVDGALQEIDNPNGEIANVRLRLEILRGELTLPAPTPLIQSNVALHLALLAGFPIAGMDKLGFPTDISGTRFDPSTNDEQMLGLLMTPLWAVNLGARSTRVLIGGNIEESDTAPDKAARRAAVLRLIYRATGGR